LFFFLLVVFTWIKFFFFLIWAMVFLLVFYSCIYFIIIYFVVQLIGLLDLKLHYLQKQYFLQFDFHIDYFFLVFFDIHKVIGTIKFFFLDSLFLFVIKTLLFFTPLHKFYANSAYSCIIISPSNSGIVIHFFLLHIKHFRFKF